MKRAAIIILLLLSVSLITSCNGNGSPSEAALRVLTDPNPINMAVDGRFYYRMTLTETNGIGIEITGWRSTDYNADDSLRNTADFTAANFADWFVDCGGSGTYIPGGTSRCNDWYYEGGAAYMIVAFFGLDDLGNDIESSVRLDFLDNRSRSLFIAQSQ
jgi:hypothetical protein